MIFVVGDSTVSQFEEVYYYHRYGYGTMLYNYFKDGIKVLNLALSGRSSKSFLKEDNYNKLISMMNKGDYLFIGFGHNDEKDDDPNRYTSALGDINDAGSFKNVLYYNYIKKAIDCGATPIICTPICRLDESNKYDGKFSHVTKNGDYAKCIKSLAKEVGITCIDLTTYSKDINIRDGYELSCLRHAITKGKLDGNNIVPDIGSVDTTHLNIFGAKTYAFYIAKCLKLSDNPIKELIKDELVEPKIEADLVRDKDYVYIPYKSPDFRKYEPRPWFKCDDLNYVGTAFGDTGRGISDTNNGYVAKEIDNKFIVGQYLQEGQTPLGKISLNSEGIALVARQIKSNLNFRFSARATILETTSEAQSGFGLGLRDDLYLGIEIPDKTIVSNYVAASVVNTPINSKVNSKRENGQLTLENNKIDYLSKGAVVDFEIYRLGQVVEVKTTVLDKTYTTTYTDFDFTKVDKDYFYIYMYATRSTLVEFSCISYNELGESQGA